ncbi:RNA polymerase II transcriptional coactivator KELP-like [Papaver somniferum]|uniref:RNA polymerase II transcriptional coactivator KELP-like n=1 Tax=Papaver somniferum TaxID=3469 RepID=UPI000E6FB0A6|nr:RNA polymerase II transcriptional coactivator KELP-like [Papaver somniferum]
MEEENNKDEIKKTVIKILKTSDMNVMTESKIRKLAGDKLGFDLSGKQEKKFIREIVNEFLVQKEDEVQDKGKQQVEEEEQEEKEVEEEEEKEEEEEEKKRKRPGVSVKEYEDNGDLIICQLSSRRKVTIQEFKGKALVSIREYYEKDGKELPSTKGISLTAEQWFTFSKSVPGIEQAIKKMQTRSR